jgi:Outer membrane protein beta-barrel domain
MLRKMLLVFGLCMVAALSAQAQDDNKAEVFGGYTYMRFRSSPNANLNGWEASAQYKFRDWIGGVADFDGHYGSIRGNGTSTYTYLFGPQISWPARVSPFGHLLLGGAHNSTAGVGNSSFSMALGGGIDVTLTDKFRWRVLQADYLLTQFGGGSQNNARLSTGIIFRF